MMASRTAAVRIVGAGPAGLVAAIMLARAGRAVQLFERRADCGARFRGDLQGLENWSSDLDVTQELRGLGLEVNFDCDPTHRAIETNGRIAHELRFDRPGFYIVKRGTDQRSLDQGLKRQALAAGVDLKFRASVPPEEADIIATGPVTSEIFAVDRGIVFATDAPDVAVALVGEEVARRGYAYLLVTRGYGCLCSVLFDDFHQASACLARARAVLTERFGLTVRDEHGVGGEGHYALEPRFRVGRALCVGEAAGLQDLLWGFGIRTAIQSGALAARALLDGLDYERLARARFRARQRAGVVNRFLFEALRPGDYRLVLAALKTDTLARLRSFYGYNRLQRLLFPLARAYVRRRLGGLRL